MTQAASTLDISLVVIATGRTPERALFSELLVAVREQLENLRRSYEVIVVDDGIGHEFAEAVLQARKNWQNLRLIQFRRSFGESVALDAASEKAHGRYIVAMTWYLQVDPEAIPRAIAALDGGEDFIAGWRTPRIDGVFARFQSWLFNAYTRMLTDVRLNDLNCSFRAFRRGVVQELHFHGDLFRFMSILAIQKGFRVVELPLRHLKEVGRTAFLHPGQYIRRFLDILSLFFLIKFTQKPLRFFGLAGAAFFFVGMGICIWMLYEKFQLDLRLADRPLLILGIFLLVLGFIVGSIGLIGEIIIYTQGRGLRDYHIDRIVEGGEGSEKNAS